MIFSSNRGIIFTERDSGLINLEGSRQFEWSQLPWLVDLTEQVLSATVEAEIELFDCLREAYEDMRPAFHHPLYENSQAFKLAKMHKLLTYISKER